ncbi:MAG: hypothetical protein IJ351_03245 [Oscillospiraceae bacterium]|nr:hypothetical protein [Oscillospiraceae bacterium]
MSRRKNSIQNAAVALISEIVVALVGFLFPRAIIVNYGSDANGLVTSLQQIMQYFVLVEAGLSGAAVFALYEPLAQNDLSRIQRILGSARKMYSKIGMVFLALVLVTSAVYPLVIAKGDYAYWEVAALFCLMATNGASQLLFIGKYKVLLNASQNSRYVALINSASTCLYSGLIILGSYIRLPLLLAVGIGVLAYLVRAAAYYFAVRKLFPDYSFRGKGDYHFDNQKEVFIQQILTMLVANSSVLLLSFTKTELSEISVFTVYNMVLTAVFLLMNSVHTGVSASFGDLIARKEQPKLQKAYGEYQALYHVFWTVVFTCVSVLYQPFIAIYAGEFTDAVYVRPLLCVLFSINGALWTLRLEQSVPIAAAGLFKEIQRGSIIEAIVTVVLSAAGLLLWGIEGMMVGRIIACLYRVTDFLCKNHRRVLGMKIWFTLKGLLASTGVMVLVNLVFGIVLKRVTVDNYFKWILLAVAVAVISAVAALAANALLYPGQYQKILGKYLRKNRGD